MAYMIPPHQAGTRPLLAYRDHLQSRHDAWASAAMGALQSVATEDPLSQWGTEAKRLVVTMEDNVEGEAERHPLGEVINQCATIERLLDAMAWIAQQPGGAEAVVRLCHPTASSNKTSDQKPDGVADHDLVVEVAGQQWRFEVSDVANDKNDGNRKEAKDLDSLECGIDQNLPDDGVRRFLVVSSEFGRLLKRKHATRRTRAGAGRNGKAPPGWQYRFHGCGRTVIAELRAIPPDGDLVVVEASAVGLMAKPSSTLQG